MNTFEMLKSLLQEHSITFRTVHHQPTSTSEASAKARGEDLSIGAKAIVMKVDSQFKLLVLSAALRIDSKKIKEYFKARTIRFASAEELQQLTGLVPGSVPPFGKPILNLDVFVDRSVLKHEKVAFNAGSLTDSIVMQTNDYMECAHPKVFDFSQGNTEVSHTTTVH